MKAPLHEEKLPQVVFHWFENLLSAVVNIEVVPELSALTTNVIVSLGRNSAISGLISAILSFFSIRRHDTFRHSTWLCLLTISLRVPLCLESSEFRLKVLEYYNLVQRLRQ